MITVASWQSELKHRRPELFQSPEHGPDPLLVAIFEQLDEQGHLAQQGLKRLVARFCKARGRCQSSPEGRRLLQVLKAINEETPLTLPLPPQPVPAHRPTLGPSSPAQALRFTTLERQAAFLDRQRIPHTREGRWLALAMGLTTELGAGRWVAAGILANLTPGDLGRDGRLTTPAHFGDPEGYTYRVHLPRRLRDQLAHWDESDFPGLAAPTDPNTARDRLRKMDGALARAFEAFNANFEREVGTPPPGQRVTTWSRFGHEGRILAVHRGIPNFLLAPMRDYPLPTEVASLGPEELTSQRRIRPSDARAHTPPQTDPYACRPPGPTRSEWGEPPSDWAPRVRTMLRAFTNRAARHTNAKGQVTSQTHQDQLAQFTNELLAQADQHAPGTSILHLALHWGFALLCPQQSNAARSSKPVKVSTVATYFTRLFGKGQLLSEATWDLASWDEDTVTELTDQALANRARRQVTQNLFLTTWAQFLGFTQHHAGILQGVAFSHRAGILRPGFRRTEILTTGEVDGLLHRLKAGDSRDHTALACALVLGAYGGLRASEVCGLTLGAVYPGDEELWVWVVAGKTDAARRAIPLHLVAPPFATDLLRQWHADRRAEFAPKRNPREIGLFGPAGHSDAYARGGLIDPLINWLRPMVGEAVDFHLLRHTAASWLLVRWFAANDPTFRQAHAFPSGWAFTTAGVNSAHYLLEGALAPNGGPSNDALLALAKFMGHQGTDTLYHHYLHTLGMVHGWVLDQLDNDQNRGIPVN